MQGVIMNLLSYINGSMIHDTNYHLALALLKHLPEIQDLSLVEMAGNCFVSQAIVITQPCGKPVWTIRQTSWIDHNLPRKSNRLF